MLLRQSCTSYITESKTFQSICDCYFPRLEEKTLNSGLDQTRANDSTCWNIKIKRAKLQQLNVFSCLRIYSLTHTAKLTFTVIYKAKPLLTQISPRPHTHTHTHIYKHTVKHTHKHSNTHTRLIIRIHMHTHSVCYCVSQ